MLCHKIVCVVGLIFVGPVIAFGQIDPDNHHIVKYRDGSIFIGKLVESDDKRPVLIVSTGDSLHLQANQIKKWRTVSDKIDLKQEGKFHYQKGIFASFDLGGSFDGEGSGQFDLIIGYRKDQKMSLGVGTGAHLNSKTFGHLWLQNDFIPLYAYGRRYLGDRNAGPFMFAKLGYGFPLRNQFFVDDFSGGLFVQSGFGLHVASRGKYRFIISISEYLQHTRGSQQERDIVFNNPIDLDYSILYTRLMLKVGIEFK